MVQSFPGPEDFININTECQSGADLPLPPDILPELSSQFLPELTTEIIRKPVTAEMLTKQEAPEKGDNYLDESQYLDNAINRLSGE